MTRRLAARLALVVAAALAGPPGPGPAPLQASQEADRVQPAGVGWDGFPAFVWRLDHGTAALPEELVAPFGGTNVEGEDPAEWALAQGLDLYIGRAAGWSELHLRREFDWYDTLWKRWFEERDAALCVREPCLTDPATRDRLAANVDATLSVRDGRHGLFVLLGDEVSLTPWGDPFDLCTSPTCTAAWNAWVKATGANANGRRMPTTDRVRVAFGDGNTDELGAWLARRRFHQDVVLDTLRNLGRKVRRDAPGSKVGLAGLVGRTAFGGVAFEELTDVLDVLEPYPVSDARELAFTLRSDEKILTTVFAHGLELADETTPGNEEAVAAAAAWQVWEHWLRGGDGVILWSDRELSQSETVRERLAQAVADVRALQDELGPWRPQTSVLAVLHDGDSVALAWLRDALLDGATWPRRFQGYQEEHGTRERALRAWLRLAEDTGHLPGALPLDRVDASTVERFPVLVANHLAVMGEADLERLASYLQAGGTLLVHGPFADFDRAGRPYDEPVFARLRDAHPERVVRAPDVPSYLDARLDERPRAVELRAWLTSLARAADIAPLPFTVDVEGQSLPWLVARAGTSEEVYALLPNLQSNGTRAKHLGDVRMAVEGGSVTWLHPVTTDGEGLIRLAPGEASVFRFRRER